MGEPARAAPIAPSMRRRERPAVLALVAVAAAALTYVLHHLPPLEQHAVEVVLTVVASAALLVLVPALAEAGRHHPLLPVVLVAGPDERTRRPATEQDVPFTAALQARALEHGFFVGLGPRFLRAYHRTFLDSPYAVALVAEVAGQPVGMLLGTLDPSAHRRWVLRRRGVSLLLLGIPAMLGRPIVAGRFLRTRLTRYLAAWRRHRKAREPSSGRLDRPPAVLSHVAVLPGARGTGSGRGLVDAFVAHAAVHGTRRVVLATLRGGPAEDFYRRLGWTPAADPAPRNDTPMRTLSLDLKDSA